MSRPSCICCLYRPCQGSAPSDIELVSRASKRAAQQHYLHVLRQIDFASDLIGSTSKYVWDGRCSIVADGRGVGVTLPVTVPVGPFVYRSPRPELIVLSRNVRVRYVLVCA